MGRRKLRNRPKTESCIEMYCMTCKVKRTSRAVKHLCLTKYPSGKYRLSDDNCDSCHHKTGKFIKKEYADKLIAQGVKFCNK